jgi:hypothetical protein
VSATSTLTKTSGASFCCVLRAFQYTNWSEPTLWAATSAELQHAEQERTQNEMALALRHFGLLREVDRLWRPNVPQLRQRPGARERKPCHRNAL